MGRLLKQLIDLLAALSISGAFLDQMGVARLVIKLTSKGPVFFKQERSGLNGKPFIMYKFRTMVTNAEQLKTRIGRAE